MSLYGQVGGLVLDRKSRVLSVVTEGKQKNEYRYKSVNTYGGLDNEEVQSENREGVSDDLRERDRGMK